MNKNNRRMGIRMKKVVVGAVAANGLIHSFRNHVERLIDSPPVAGVEGEIGLSGEDVEGVDGGEMIEDDNGEHGFKICAAAVVA
ncbi:hypothetical protein L2E82_08070 [Cichorium intybus]|uniref:Uncharacterized protein n=1 Tax=Cichorium intybus TaxID=13427 RepID=A0ACB9G5J8_CICIN|nr:hypothetical protein L2E82_08070 [Cichorium intybus]